MGSRPRTRERWPIPRTTRHVWVLRDHRYQVPWQGFVIEWRRRSSGPYALVVYVPDDAPEGVTEVRCWISAARLVPVRSVPEELMENRVFEDRLWRSKHSP